MQRSDDDVIGRSRDHGGRSARRRRLWSADVNSVLMLLLLLPVLPHDEYESAMILSAFENRLRAALV